MQAQPINVRSTMTNATATATADAARAKTAQAGKAGPTRAPAAHPAPAAGRREVFVTQDNLSLAESRRMDWYATLPSGTIAADLHMRKEPFGPVAHTLTTGDSLTMVTADDAMLFLGICVFGNRGHVALVRILDSIELPKVNEEKKAPHGYTIRRASSSEAHVHGPWLCVRDSDGWIINSGPLLTEDEAIVWLNNHPAVRALSAQPVNVATLT
jgi:hypothetical protein